MSCDVRVKGSLGYASKRALDDAVAAWTEAIDNEDECDSIVTAADLTLEGKTLAVDMLASCPASTWQETVAFLEELAQRAETGSIKCYLEGELDETIKASAKRVRAAEQAKSAKRTAKAKSKRVKPDPGELRWAAQFGDLDKIDALLAAGTDPSTPDPSNGLSTTPLMMAASHGRADAVARLIAAGAKLDAQDYAGSTALHYAVLNTGKRGRLRCLTLLVEAGANTELREDARIGGLTALQKATEWKREGRAELAALLTARKVARTTKL